MQYIQCFPLYRARVLQRIISNAVSKGAEILLDLEDGISDVTDPGQDYCCKVNGRNTLLALNNFLIGLQASVPLHIRINSINSPYFGDDVAVLKQLGLIHWRSISIPKVNDAETIEKTFEHLQGIDFEFLSPIIESLAGYDFILNGSFPTHVPIEAVFFGNYDFNLNTNQWPMVEQGDIRYKVLIKGMIDSLQQKGLIFGNSPYAKLDDLQTLYDSMDYIKGLTNNSFYQVSLNTAQTKLCQNFSVGSKVHYSVQPSTSSVDDIGDIFKNNRLNGRGFALNKSNRDLITPHEYRLSILNNK